MINEKLVYHGLAQANQERRNRGMKMTAGEFIGLLNRQGIECRIHRGRIVLTGEECDMLNSLRAVL